MPKGTRMQNIEVEIQEKKMVQPTLYAHCSRKHHCRDSCCPGYTLVVGRCIPDTEDPCRWDRQQTAKETLKHSSSVPSMVSASSNAAPTLAALSAPALPGSTLTRFPFLALSFIIVIIIIVNCNYCCHCHCRLHLLRWVQLQQGFDSPQVLSQWPAIFKQNFQTRLSLGISPTCEDKNECEEENGGCQQVLSFIFDRLGWRSGVVKKFLLGRRTITNYIKSKRKTLTSNTKKLLYF